MKRQRIVLLHATPVAVAPIQAAFAENWPEPETVNLLDDGLTIDRAREADLSEAMIERFVDFGRYAHRIGADGKPVSDDGIQFWGQSFVAAPNGQVIERASVDREEVLVVPCDLDKVEFSRTHWPFLRDRRIDAYGNITKRFVDASTAAG